MCGIFGFTGKKDRKTLEAMAQALSHRGPDDHGFYEDDSVSLGHRRLSIIDLSPQGRQPLSSEDAGVWAAVNGEIYNFKQLRKELVSLGHAFRSESDSETAVHAYEQYGEDFVLRLEGMFAIALWDARGKKLILARDRIGIKPLYYARKGRDILFASEIKAILQDAGFKKEFNEAGFFEYLAFQCVITDETMFRGVYKLEPGSLLIFKDGDFSKRRYWSLDEVSSEESSEDTVKGALAASVKSHLISDVPVGVLLSGGLDSSSIVALMHESGISGIQTFTVGFNQPDDEFDFALQVAKKFNTLHHRLVIDPLEVRGLLEKIAWHMDEPLADAGAIATYLAAQKVREFVKVVLVGEGGDEALGGYNWHRLSAPPFSILPKNIKKRLYFYLTTFYRQKDSRALDLFFRLFKERENFFTSMSGYEISSILPNSLLMKVDKMTMAHGLEARVPFLDTGFVSAALRLSPSKKASAFATKIFLRRAMRGLLPQEILKRGKHGFIVPMHKWLHGELREFCRDALLSSGNQTDRFLPRRLKERLFEPKRGLCAIENNTLLWKLFIFEVWHKKYFG